jgi:hypothetical protein
MWVLIDIICLTATFANTLMPRQTHFMLLLEVFNSFLLRVLFGDHLCLLSDLFVHLGAPAWFVPVQFCLEEDCVSFNNL